jgi:hypothetical protein
MTDAEKQLIKDLAHYMVDVALPKIIDAEVGKLPEAYGPMVQVILKALEPELVKALDKYVDEKLA